MKANLYVRTPQHILVMIICFACQICFSHKSYGKDYTPTNERALVLSYYKAMDTAADHRNLKFILSCLTGNSLYVDCNGKRYSKRTWGNALHAEFQESTKIQSLTRVSKLTYTNSGIMTICQGTLVTVVHDRKLHNILQFTTNYKTEDSWQLVNEKWRMSKSRCLVVKRSVKIFP